MADVFDMLSSVKNALNITGTYQDSALQMYIDEVNEYMRAAGVPNSMIGSKTTAGTVARGVSDLWSYGTGAGKLSEYFYERVIQLSSGGGCNG